MGHRGTPLPDTPSLKSLDDSQLRGLLERFRATQAERSVPDPASMTADEVTAYMRAAERLLDERAAERQPKAPAAVINGWRIKKWESRLDWATFTVADDEGHRITFENAWLGDNKANALAWAADQIVALEAMGNFEYACGHCKATTADPDGRTQEQRDLIEAEAKAAGEATDAPSR